IGTSSKAQPAPPTESFLARASVYGAASGYASARADVLFSQPGGPGTPVTVDITADNFALGTYAIHVHEFGDLTSANPIDGTVVGGHFNPLSAPHGCAPSTAR